MLILSKGTRGRQALILFITIFAFLSFTLFYIFNRSENIAFLFFSSFICFFVMNWLYSRLYTIHISNQEIIIKNLYTKKRVIDGRNFEEIRNTNKLCWGIMPLPFPSPPFFVLQLKDGRCYTFIDMSYKAFFTLFTLRMKAYAHKLTEQVKEHLNTHN